MNKIARTFVTGVATVALSLATLAGCSSSSSNAPSSITYDETTGDVSFETVDGVDTYTVGVVKVLNDTTGEALESINGSSTVEIDGESYYVWSEQTGSLSGLADNDDDGTISGTVVYRAYSSSASEVGEVIDATTLPLGHYILQVVPSATDESGDVENGTYEFVMSGTLATPSGFTATINDEGYIEITAPSDYYLSCYTETGLPEAMEFEVADSSGTVVETITMDDFSYTNSVNGPNKSFSFNNQTVTGTTELDSSETYTVTVTAVGDGDTILDASAEAYFASSLDEQTFATTYDVTSSGSTSVATITLTIGTDASGAEVYELTSSINSTVVSREVGTVSSSAAVETVDESTVYPEGTTLTFTATDSDGDAELTLDGQTLTVATSVSESGWGDEVTTTTNYYVEGTLSFDGESAELAASAGSSMMMMF